MRFTLFLVYSCLCCGLFAQSKVDFGRVDDNQLNDRLKVSAEELTQYILDDIPAEYMDQMTDRAAYRFADQMARSSIDVLSGGRVYNGWDEMDEYVNGVLQRVIPEELRAKKFVRAYVIKDGSPNAFMMPSGIFCINIGMIAEIESEANLAGIIGHELAHYELRHGLERYVKSENDEFKGGILFNSRKAISAFSVDNELDADSQAAEHLRRAGYGLNGLAETFAVFKRQEDRALLTMEDVWEIKETTHPSSGRRIERIHEMMAAEEESAAADPGSSAVFEKLREEARAEVLKYLLAGFNYQSCLEKAFRFHLFEPNNPTYVYYAMEAIRRSCYLDVTMWNKKFLAHNYFDVVETKSGGHKKVKIEGNFFDRFRPGILSMDSNSYSQVMAKFYWDSPKFTTNEEAYQFFYKVGKALKEPECTLSNALSLSFNPELRNKFLEEYLAFEDIRYRNFAEALLNDGIYEALPKRKLTIFHRLMPVIKHGVDDIAVWHEGDEQPLRSAMEKAATSFEDRDFLYLPELKKTNINDYLTFSELEGFSFQPLLARGEKTELHILDPAFWEVMKRYGTNRMEFVNCIYNDKAKGAFTLEVYKQVSDYTIDDVLNRDDEKGRYVKMYMSGLQILEDGPLKLRAYDGTDRMGARGRGYDLLAEVLTEKLKSLDKSLTD
ncbi:M48 family metalloprotease [Neolewinella aurantiaca]|uniref:M48 family metalloprotease n=1 Tax=Neolewinella aurantiaca TaxID=2602767 RepID=A0A5C7FK62_9BACT|nr:M48 family metallopeptidase [Neolewinella aurantiaca]TXF91709.1 M48 family metalloprotease [Neolewinella aurantiaca]